MNSRGQSALEYLMTYGWALIVIAIVVGFLIMLVIPNSDQEEYIKENCDYIGIVKDFSIRVGGFGTASKAEIVLENDRKIMAYYLPNKLETGFSLYGCEQSNGLVQYEAFR